MSQRMKVNPFPFLAALLGALGLLSSAGAVGAEQLYRVTITNLTRAQVITPPLLVSHGSDFDLFTPGAAASPELVALAEDGNTAPLEAALTGDPQVHAVAVASAPILPGGSASVDIAVEGWKRLISGAGMLASSNDAFFGLHGVRVPSRGTAVFPVPAYDAGSETNSELCAFIPGPPCGSAGQRDPAGAEGFVHVHNGIHGIGDLNAANMDWRNPVASVAITRIR